jgi:hypothetical protein
VKYRKGKFYELEPEKLLSLSLSRSLSLSFSRLDSRWRRQSYTISLYFETRMSLHGRKTAHQWQASMSPWLGMHVRRPLRSMAWLGDYGRERAYSTPDPGRPHLGTCKVSSRSKFLRLASEFMSLLPLNWLVIV